MKRLTAKICDLEFIMWEDWFLYMHDKSGRVYQANLEMRWEWNHDTGDYSEKFFFMNVLPVLYRENISLIEVEGARYVYGDQGIRYE